MEMPSGGPFAAVATVKANGIKHECTGAKATHRHCAGTRKDLETWMDSHSACSRVSHVENPLNL